jgi:signal transduction histidine kinase
VKNEVSSLVWVDLWTIVGALINVLTNALEAIGSFGELCVSTEGEHGGTVAIRVTNTGPAPSEHQIPLLFEIGASTKRDGSHMGLGLPLAHRAFTSAGGDLQMRRLGDEMTEVFMTLPVYNVRTNVREQTYATISSLDS